MQKATPINYDKWNHIDVSDSDEDTPQQPPPKRARVQPQQKGKGGGSTAAATTAWTLGSVYLCALQMSGVFLLHARLWFLDKYLAVRWWWHGHTHRKQKKALG